MKEKAIEDFFAQLPRAKRRVLASDYDGTLAPFHTDPAQAVPYEGVRERLETIMHTGTRVIMVTGRPVEQLEPLLGLSEPVETWGVHGWEHKIPGKPTIQHPLNRAKRRAIERIVEWMPEVEQHGARWERKSAGIAVHWRGLPEPNIETIKMFLQNKWKGVNLRGNAAWYDFNGGIEFRAQGWHKGKVLEVACQLPVTLAFLGDDSTDEDGFRAIKGRGLGILVRETRRSTDADVHLRPPHELLAFFDRWIEATKIPARSERAAA